MDKKTEDSNYTSADLTKELNEERKEKGLYELPEINAGLTSTGQYARMDKSFSNSLDFFVKLVKKGKKTKKVSTR